jgi:hypothetical protein
MPDLISLGDASALLAQLHDPVEPVRIAAMRALARLQKQNLLEPEAWASAVGQLPTFREWDIRAVSFLPRGDVQAQILRLIQSSPEQDIEKAELVMRAAADAVRPIVRSRGTPATDAEPDPRAWGFERWIIEAQRITPETVSAVDPEFAKHLISWLFAELVMPDYDGIHIYEGRQGGAEFASGVVAALGHKFKPDIPALFRIYTAFLRRATEYWIPWLEHWEKEGVDLHCELPPWLGSGEVAASRHIEWTLSRNGMRVLVAGLQSAFRSPSDRERWAAAQLLEWATRFESEPSPPGYYGGSGPDDVDLSQLFAPRTDLVSEAYALTETGDAVSLPATVPTASGDSSAPESSDTDTEMVDAAVFCPSHVARDSVFLVQVFLYSPKAAEQVYMQAHEADETAKRRGTYSLPLDLPLGTRVDLHLEIPGLTVAEPDATLVWRGSPTRAQFEAAVAANAAGAQAIGRVRIAVAGVPVGTLRFQVALNAAGTSAGAVKARKLRARRYRRAFVSYSSQDRAEVLRRVQAFRIAGLSIFQDILDLDAGERWQQALYREIDNCDVFLLFWSHAAAASEWVAKEIEYALARKGGIEEHPPDIQPVPIEGPPIVPPPASLSGLHFNDALLAQIRAADSA